MFSGDYSLMGAFLASQSFAVDPIYLGSLIPETEHPPSAAGVSLSSEVALLDSTPAGCLGIHLFLSQDP